MDACPAPLKADAISHDAIEAARAWLDTFDRVALATVVATWGSSPVPVGGQLVVAPDERFEGSVSGGCVEAEVIFAAGEAIASGKPKLLEFGVSNETAWRSGLPCGGTIEIFVEALDADKDTAYLERVLKARRDRTPLVVAKNLADGAREILDTRKDDPLQSGESRIVDTQAGRVFLHVLQPVLHVIIVGATHVGQVLADLAMRVGWKVRIVDPREAFAQEDRFGAVERHTDWPKDALATMGLDSRTAVVALTHIGHIDDEALIAALRSDCFYVGALGSRRSHTKRVERLQAAGASESEIARIRAPVGLAIGAKGPEEIAVSILAEIIRDQRGA